MYNKFNTPCLRGLHLDHYGLPLISIDKIMPLYVSLIDPRNTQNLVMEGLVPRINEVDIIFRPEF